MKIKELIKELEKFDSELEVLKVVNPVEEITLNKNSVTFWHVTETILWKDFESEELRKGDYILIN